jgi:hypothetical protein
MTFGPFNHFFYSRVGAHFGDQTANRFLCFEIPGQLKVQNCHFLAVYFCKIRILRIRFTQKVENRPKKALLVLETMFP